MVRPFITGTLLASWAAAAGIWATMCLLVVLLGRRYGQIKRSWISCVAAVVIATACMIISSVIWAILCFYGSSQVGIAIIFMTIGICPLPTFFAWGWLGRFFQLRSRALFGKVAAGILAGVALFVLGILPTEGRMQDFIVGVIDSTKLNSIGKGLLMYELDHGYYPNDLRALVDAGSITRSGLLCTISDSQPTDSHPYSGPVDFGHIQLPTDAPDGLVWAWQDPRFNGGEGGYLLYKSTGVTWADPKTIERELARTRTWLAEQSLTSQPATAATQ